MTRASIPDAVAAVISEGERWLEVREDQGPNRNVAIDFFNYQTLPAWQPFPNGMKGAPWCASFVSTIGQLALGHAWPVERTPSCQRISEWARSRNVFFEPPAAAEVGDLFLLFYQGLGRYGHVGFVRGVQDGTILTLEGNTGPDGSREGFGVFKRSRSVTQKTAFVRWADAL